jgi:hypothetical protein
MAQVVVVLVETQDLPTVPALRLLDRELSADQIAWG